MIEEAQGTHFPWTHVESRNSKKNVSSKFFRPVSNPLMEANSVPIRQSGMFHQRSSHRQALQKSVFSRLGSRSVLGYPGSQSGTAKNTDNSNLTGLNSSVAGIDLSLNLGPNYTMATRKEVIVEHPTKSK